MGATLALEPQWASGALCDHQDARVVAGFGKSHDPYSLAGPAGSIEFVTCSVLPKRTAGDAFATRRDDLAADVDDLAAGHGYLLDPTRQEPDTPLLGGGAVEDDLVGEYGSAPIIQHKILGHPDDNDAIIDAIEPGIEQEGITTLDEQRIEEDKDPFMAPIFESEPIKPLPDVILRDRVPRRFESAAGFEPRRFRLLGLPRIAAKARGDAQTKVPKSAIEWCDLVVYLLS